MQRRRAAFAIIVGTIAGLYAWLGIVIHHGSFVPDFQFFWSSARILLSGRSPYIGFPTPVPDPLYYPLPTVLAAVPVAWLPLSVAAGLFLCSQGVIQNLRPYTVVTTVEGAKQTIAQGPVASQEAIKQLGTNGGGFFNANSSHPFENPTPFSNLLAMFLIFVIPGALT